MIQSGKSVIIQDCQADPRWAGRVDQKTGFQTKSMICVPLALEDVVFGCIQIITKTDAVAGCVVFKSMKPSKKDYRKYNIKTVAGPDDYASMQEVVRRRYSRMMEEGTTLPDLIITDGGLGQMSVVREVVADELHLSIPIAGLAKDDRHRTNELLFGNPPKTIALKTDSELFHVLTQIQDEVHRYAISFHRDKRSKHALHSALDDIPGIGPATRDRLLKAFKSVKRIQEASIEDLEKIVGAVKALKIKEGLEKKA